MKFTAYKFYSDKVCVEECGDVMCSTGLGELATLTYGAKVPMTYTARGHHLQVRVMKKYIHLKKLLEFVKAELLTPHLCLACETGTYKSAPGFQNCTTCSAATSNRLQCQAAGVCGRGIYSDLLIIMYTVSVRLFQCRTHGLR